MKDEKLKEERKEEVAGVIGTLVDNVKRLTGEEKEEKKRLLKKGKRTEEESKDHRVKE